MIDSTADPAPTPLAARRWLPVLFAIALLACGSMAGNDSGAGRTPSARAAPSPVATARATPPTEPPSPADAVREWIRAAPGREGASVERVEPATFPHEPMLHVVARDGALTLDAWVPADLHGSADAYWLVAELVSLARSAAIDDLVRSPDLALWTIAGQSMLCREPTGACYGLPAQRRVAELFCQPGGRRCTMVAEGEDGRVAEWHIDVTSGGMHRRRVRSWPAIAEPLEGRWDAGARIERGPSERLPAVERPALADDPAFEERGGTDPDSDPDGLGEDPCTPTLRSLRRGELVVRTVGCGELPSYSITEWPAAFVVTRGGSTETAPLFIPSPGPPGPLRPFDVSVLAGQDAIGFVAEASDGPEGVSSDHLWVLVPASGSEGARVHSLGLGEWSRVGLGTEEESEGYVVGIDRSRSTFEVTGPGAGRFVACERWTGTHARRSDRWRGIRRAAQLDLPVTFDPDRGFAMSEDDRPALDTCARADSP